MKNIDLEKAEFYLSEMSDLLTLKGSSSSWAEKLRSLADKKTMHPDDFRFEIKRLYGGMGSLNDIVICDSEGKMDREANIKFDDLRRKLYGVV